MTRSVCLKATKGLVSLLVFAQIALLGALALTSVEAFATPITAEEYIGADGTFYDSKFFGAEKEPDGLLPCPSTALSQHLREGWSAGLTKSLQDSSYFYGEQLKAENAHPRRYLKGKIFDTYCLSIYYDFFNLIQMLISGASMIGAAIVAALNALLNYVCEYINAAASNLMNAFCLPLPDISLTLELPAVTRKTCDGLSLADVIKVGPGTPLTTLNPLPPDFLSKPMSRWLGSTSGSGRF